MSEIKDEPSTGARAVMANREPIFGAERRTLARANRGELPARGDRISHRSPRADTARKGAGFLVSHIA